MPEYSTPKLTPAETTKLTGMNSGSSGYFEVKDVLDIIRNTYGQNNGVATLGSDGKLPSSQLPDLADDVIVVDSYSTLPAIGTAGKLYITADNNKMYRWDPELTTPDYVELSIDLSEYATIADLQDGTLEPLISTKAKQDQNGNVIDTTYATKTELAAEESARESEDSNLKDAIQGNTARIENLEQEHGGYVTVNYRGTNFVPTGKAKYALVESIVGKSRAWNQLISKSSGTTTLTGYGQFANRSTSIPAGHAVLVSVKTDLTNAPKSVTNSVHINVSSTASSGNYINTDMARVGGVASGIFNFTYVNSSIFLFSFSSSSYDGTDVLSFSELFVRDLNLIFPEYTTNEIISLGIPNLVKLCPDLLDYDAFGTSMVDTTVEGVKSISRNRLNPTTFKTNLVSWGGTDNGDGTVSISASQLSGKVVWQNDTNQNIVSVYFKGSNASYNYANLRIIYTDGTADAGIRVNTWQTSNSNKVVDKIVGEWSSGITTFELAECGIITGSTTTFSSYTESTLSLPTSVTLRSAGDVADTDELNVEVLVDGVKVNKRRQTTKIGTYTFTGNEVWENNGANAKACNVISSIVKSFGAGNINNILFPTLVTDTYNNIYNGTVTGAIGLSTAGLLAISNSDYSNRETLITGKTINFELATESVTLLDPIENNTILTEGGGTIETVQTQTPVIDNCLDVGYLAL